MNTILINRKVDYAIRCLVYLAKQKPAQIVTTAELSRRLRISRPFIAKIFQLLVRQGIVEGEKGKGGGFRLKNRQVSLAKIIRLLDPNLALNKCLKKGFHCFMREECPVHYILCSMQRELFQRLDKIQLSGLTNKIGRNKR
ncbi:hypothetical protein A2311_03745 [candidate division WOR-1 bacterium RIFOXYB2_FULL_48_7]|uniref:Rrf2 family transcriptional regulator n=1 Tax=candidate division WOR-1 bacterium RIFOXYB2_FULL_48_7 TaxID=1802583 RepID=A0A1F4TF04_UNCSA|nr:MAG: hypothetical protein A2311_03745 [candidate division WOR-1 bacterium RIFOXYB2_FULL_48_7]